MAQKFQSTVCICLASNVEQSVSVELSKDLGAYTTKKNDVALSIPSSSTIFFDSGKNIDTKKLFTFFGVPICNSNNIREGYLFQTCFESKTYSRKTNELN